MLNKEKLFNEAIFNSAINKFTIYECNNDNKTIKVHLIHSDMLRPDPEYHSWRRPVLDMTTIFKRMDGDLGQIGKGGRHSVFFGI